MGLFDDSNLGEPGFGYGFDEDYDAVNFDDEDIYSGYDDEDDDE